MQQAAVMPLDISPGFASVRANRARRGFTIFELATGLAVVGLTTLIAMPKIEGTVARALVKSARSATFNRLTSARLAAQQGGRVVVFRVSGGAIWAEARPRLVAVAGSTKDTLGPIIDLTNQYRVSVSSGVDSIVFDPKGLGSGAGTISIARGAAIDSVAVTGWGSVTR
jgi:Tfp pilus assembly protein FimT